MTKVISIIILVPVIFAVINLTFNSQVPTPSHSQQANFNCGIVALSMLAAESKNRDIPFNKWGITNSTASVDELLSAWKQVVGENLKEANAVSFDKPFLWIGIYEGAPHACLCYFSSTNVFLKHGVFDPSTKTNYIVKWDYVQFLTNTSAFYKP